MDFSSMLLWYEYMKESDVYLEYITTTNKSTKSELESKYPKIPDIEKAFGTLHYAPTKSDKNASSIDFELVFSEEIDTFHQWYKSHWIYFLEHFEDAGDFGEYDEDLESHNDEKWIDENFRNFSIPLKGNKEKIVSDLKKYLRTLDYGDNFKKNIPILKINNPCSDGGIHSTTKYRLAKDILIYRLSKNKELDKNDLLMEMVKSDNPAMIWEGKDELVEIANNLKNSGLSNKNLFKASTDSVNSHVVEGIKRAQNNISHLMHGVFPYT